MRVLDLIFPPRCTACNERIEIWGHDLLCGDCSGKINLIGPPLCPQCAAPFASGLGGDHLCFGCRTDPPPFEKTFAFGHYEGVLLDLIHNLKFGRKTRVARVLAGMILNNMVVKPRWEDYDLIIPIPLHKMRLRGRGFNQAHLVGRRLAGAVGVREDGGILQKTRESKAQTELDGKERLKNVKGVFGVDKKRAGEVEDKNILLIDDVFTTGATVREGAKVLKKAGAKRVDVLTVARTI